MPWKVRVHQTTEDDVRHRTIATYPRSEELELVQTLAWWARYLEPGDSIEIQILPEVSSESDPGK